VLVNFNKKQIVAVLEPISFFVVSTNTNAYAVITTVLLRFIGSTYARIWLFILFNFFFLMTATVVKEF